jgi:hypothetical protein
MFDDDVAEECLGLYREFFGWQETARGGSWRWFASVMAAANVADAAMDRRVVERMILFQGKKPASECSGAGLMIESNRL